MPSAMLPIRRVQNQKACPEARLRVSAANDCRWRRIGADCRNLSGRDESINPQSAAAARAVGRGTTVGPEQTMPQAELQTGRDRLAGRGRPAGGAGFDGDSGLGAGAKLRRHHPAGRRVFQGRHGAAGLCRRKPRLDQVLLGRAGARTAAQAKSSLKWCWPRMARWWCRT